MSHWTVHPYHSTHHYCMISHVLVQKYPISCSTHQFLISYVFILINSRLSCFKCSKHYFLILSFSIPTHTISPSTHCFLILTYTIHRSVHYISFYTPCRIQSKAAPVWFSGNIYETGTAGISSQAKHFIDRWNDECCPVCAFVWVELRYIWAIFLLKTNRIGAFHGPISC